MSASAPIDDRFLQPLQSTAKAFEMAEVPMLIFVGSGLDDYTEQVSALLGSTVVYSSQADFEQQLLASIKRAGYLFAVIDKPLAGRAYRLVQAYLAARDVVGADDTRLAQGFNAGPPHKDHRLALLVDRATFEAHSLVERRSLSELSTRIAVA